MSQDECEARCEAGAEGMPPEGPDTGGAPEQSGRAPAAEPAERIGEPGQDADARSSDAEWMYGRATESSEPAESSAEGAVGGVTPPGPTTRGSADSGPAFPGPALSGPAVRETAGTLRTAVPVDRGRAAGPSQEGRQRLLSALWPPRVSRAQLVVALLLFTLGLGLAIQVSSTNQESQLRGARQEDLVRILDELDGRQQRLQSEKHQLEQSLTQLESSSNQAKEAQEQTRRKGAALGVLAGTVRATGPGITLTIKDPEGHVKADMLLDTLQELRAAGAEAIQINDVRVVADTYFTDPSSGGVRIDGKSVSQPYEFTVIGNPQDLQPALNIPGGVVRTLEKEQATATITEEQELTVDALIKPKAPEYARPAQP